MSQQTINKEIQQEQKTNLTKVPKEIFEEIIANDGISVAELNKKGAKVLLFFTTSIGKKKKKLLIHVQVVFFVKVH